jgi:putative restriction endonuclease
MTQPNEAKLRWFQLHAGRTVTWQDLKAAPWHLVTAAKGIYKPQGSEYALSVKQTLDSPYPDEEPVYQQNGSWTYRYAQEGDSSDPEQLNTNRGLMNCLRDGVPVGVIRQRTKKPDVTRYQVLGLATVADWNQGIFTLHSTLLEEPSTILQESFRATMPGELPFGFDPTLVSDARKKVFSEVVRRQGQQAFRSGLLTAYEGRCAITGCLVEPVLEAAHITPYLGPATNNVTNGLLLRSDLHTLWDSGLIYLESNFRIRVKDSLFQSDYSALSGETVFVPKRLEIRPSEAAVRAHREWSLAD